MKLTKAERERQREERRLHQDCEHVWSPDNLYCLKCRMPARALPTPKTVTPVAKTSITLAPVPVVEWHGMYDDSWRGMITPESFAHPAKAGRRLLSQIFNHLATLGVKPGAIICDPFGGIGTTAIMGAWKGYHVVCCELEPKFVALANDNLALHREKWEAMHRPIPVIVQGDSRQLRQHVKEPLAAIVSSPPYADAINSPEHGIDQTKTYDGKEHGGQLKYPNAYADRTEGQLGAMKSGDVDAVVSSPPYSDQATHSGSDTPTRSGVDEQGNPRGGKTVYQYGETEGQIGHMIDKGVDAIVSSPPYEEIATGAGGLNTKPAKDGQQGGRSADSPSQDTDQKYGDTEGQLAKMEKGQVEAIVSSPPYADQPLNPGETSRPEVKIARLIAEGKLEEAEAVRRNCSGDASNLRQHDYGSSDDQLGAMHAGDVDAIISSPPYAHGLGSHVDSEGPNGRPEQWKGASQPKNQYGESEGQLGRLKEDEVDAIISSPPYAETLLNDDQRQAGKGEPLRWGTNEEYGTSPGQLGVLKEKSGVDAVVSSPPYVAPPGHDTGHPRLDATEDARRETEGSARRSGYGHEAGNIADLRDDSVDAVVTSPPYGSGDSASAQSITTRTDKSAMWIKANLTGSACTEGYGTSEGQMAEMTMKHEADTFWTAARDIVRESYELLRPGGYAVWIVKAFVRDKTIVDFPGDWRKLCEYVGFETVTEVRAMLVKQQEYVNLLGHDTVEKTERKSFFRRLAESKGSPKIDHETVWIMRKR